LLPHDRLLLLSPYTPLFRSCGHLDLVAMHVDRLGSADLDRSDIRLDVTVVQHPRGDGARAGADDDDADLGGTHPRSEPARRDPRSEEHTSELQSPDQLVCRL